MPPRDTRTQNFTFYVPADYDSVQLHAVVITSRRKLAFDRKVRSEPGGKRDLDLVSLDMPGTLRRPLDIDEPSWLRRLTRSERVLVVSRNTSPHGDTGDGCYFSPYLDASIERKSEWDKDRSAPACGKRNMRFERYYGLVSSEAASELDVRARPMSNTAATATSKKPGS
jgi:hypothetical protein